ncbi:hypothetical protein F8M41_024309 [Gigaspora margarita]|uniref:Uncharacterized protein n=1 Tax=Gigaspora margarita TaxID=4874 RepID=A0A8H4B0H0_GIGMA|nr:hypothetical protein F8M41_024309 [Gigaspora margarita]
MNVKYRKTNVVAKYIYITANGPIEILYKNLREHNSLIDIEVFIQRVRFIIKFEEDPTNSRIEKDKRKAKNIEHSKQYILDEYSSQIESSEQKYNKDQVQNINKKQKLEFDDLVNSEYNSQISGYDINDSEYTKDKSGKIKLIARNQ